ncbi:MAG: 7-cyano-7-deazaguanine synthase [Actinomadura sp.]
MQEIADVVAQDNQQGRVIIDTPYLWRTKAQLVNNLPRDLDPILAASISCDTGFSGRRRERGLARHCGGCSSCLLRRQALIASDRPELETIDYRGVAEGKKQHLNAMLWQVARMAEALTADDPWSALIQEFPDALCVPSAMDIQTQERMTGLYQQYCTEWTASGVAQRLGFEPSDWGLPAARARLTWGVESIRDW